MAHHQPALLFAAIPEIMLLAAGRSPANGAAQADVQRAACSFIRSALLYPDADHYALLGLQRSSSPGSVKEHYRLLMRLVHPDFADTGTQRGRWPADAASRLNRAYDTLSSPQRRRQYDEGQLPPTVPPRPSPASRPSPRHASLIPAEPKRRAPEPRLLLKRLSAGFGVTGTAAVAALFVIGAGDRDSLVQRPAGRLPAHVSAPAGELFAPASSPAVARPQPPPPEAAASPARPAPAAKVMASVKDAYPAHPAQDSASVAALPFPARPADHGASGSGTPAVAPPQPAPATAAPRAPNVPAAPGVTMADVHPLLSRLLQQLESGGSERILGLLEADARRSPGAQALIEHYNSVVDGDRSVRVAQVQFKAEPQDGGLLVTGEVTMQVGEGRGGMHRELSVQAVFARRNGAVVMTHLARHKQ